jgi:hypothetical protein
MATVNENDANQDAASEHQKTNKVGISIPFFSLAYDNMINSLVLLF